MNKTVDNTKSNVNANKLHTQKSNVGDVRLNILFCCTNNQIRSVIAYDILKKIISSKQGKLKEIQFDQAGVASQPKDFIIIGILEAIGIDYSNHSPKIINQNMIQKYNRIICLSIEAYKFILSNYCDNNIISKNIVELWKIPKPEFDHSSMNQKKASINLIKNMIFNNINEKIIL